jgi:hypothetical protein
MTTTAVGTPDPEEEPLPPPVALFPSNSTIQNSFIYQPAAAPTRKTIEVTEREFDAEGRCVKEKRTTETTETSERRSWYPSPYTYGAGGGGSITYTTPASG